MEEALSVLLGPEVKGFSNNTVSRLKQVWTAETKEVAEKAFNLFVKTDEAKYPKATLCLQKDAMELLAFYDFPAQYWQSIRTCHPIESSFVTIRHRTKRSKGCLSREGCYI